MNLIENTERAQRPWGEGTNAREQLRESTGITWIYLNFMILLMESMGIYGHLWEMHRIWPCYPWESNGNYGNLSESTGFVGNLLEFLEYGGHGERAQMSWNLREFMEIYGNLMEIIGIYWNLLDLLVIYGNYWNTVAMRRGPKCLGIYGNLRKSMGI